MTVQPRVKAADAFPMSEAELQTAILDLARHLGFRAYHTFDSRRSDAGYPDLTLVRDGRLIFAELKSAKGRLSEFQARWIDALEATPAEVYVWRPIDWTSGRLEALLRDDEDVL